KAGGASLRGLFRKRNPRAPSFPHHFCFTSTNLNDSLPSDVSSPAPLRRPLPKLMCPASASTCPFEASIGTHWPSSTTSAQAWPPNAFNSSPMYIRPLTSRAGTPEARASAVTNRAYALQSPFLLLIRSSSDNGLAL